MAHIACGSSGTKHTPHDNNLAFILNLSQIAASCHTVLDSAFHLIGNQIRTVAYLWRAHLTWSDILSFSFFSVSAVTSERITLSTKCRLHNDSLFGMFVLSFYLCMMRTITFTNVVCNRGRLFRQSASRDGASQYENRLCHVSGRNLFSWSFNCWFVSLLE